MSAAAIAKSQSSAPKETVSLANYLLNEKKSKLRARNGKSGIIAIKRSSFREEDPTAQLETLLRHQYILKCDKDPDTNELILLNTEYKDLVTFDAEKYYVWLYKGSQLWARLYGIGILAVILIGVLYPLWPPFMQTAMWYVSMAGIGFLIFMMVLGVLRFIIWLFTKVFVPPGIWIFPNLFADCGFFESFVPLYVWDLPKPKK